MHLRLPAVLAFAALPLGLAACSGKSEKQIAEEDNTYLPADAPPTAKERPVELQPLVHADYEGRLDAGLGCNFTSADGRNLFVATAPDDAGAKAKALLKLGGDFRTLHGMSAGGYASLQGGGSFTDGNVTATLTRGEGTGRPEGIESTVWPADLTVAVSDGNQARFAGGEWSCGA